MPTPTLAPTDGSTAVDVLCTVSELSVRFSSTLALDAVSFALRRGEIVAVVGESGSGKSTTAAALLGLLDPTAAVIEGSIRFEGRELLDLDERGWRQVRGRQIALVPQDPMTNLDPVIRIGDQVAESYRAHQRVSRAAGQDRALQALADAGLADARTRARRYPHQFSGGMNQRALIASGLINEPQLLIADEPTSALDTTVQRRILDVLSELVQRTGSTLLLITHDLGLAADRADRVIVMRHGRIVEEGRSGEVLHNPGHPYTQELLAATPGRREVALRSEAREPQEPLLALTNVRKSYGRRGRSHLVLDGVSLTVDRGATTALVGESGSGKSTTAAVALGLLTPDSGSVVFDGVDVHSAGRSQVRELRRRLQPVFQDPYASLDPVMTVEGIVSEPLRVLTRLPKEQRRRRVHELLDQVALERAVASRHPSELSGGQRQRVAIARALAASPDLIVCDEPVSALDVLVQAQILELLQELQRELGLSYLLISHDLGVVRELADQIHVLHGGAVVESGGVEVLRSPTHPQTVALLEAEPGRSLIA